ncbi:MAG: sulfotransferase [Acidisphaera sp.]|nr:sulfotransferase [Acidisphaera sp.]
MSDAPAESALQAALGAYNGGDYATATAQFAALRRRAPDDPTLLRLHGLALVRADEVSAGLPLLARARRLAPADPLASLHHGVGLHAAGRLEAAIAAFRDAAALRPQDAAALINLSVALLDHGDAPGAREAAGQAVLRDAGAADAWLALGRALAQTRELGAARAALRKAVGLRPDHAASRVSLGLACYRLGDAEGALHAMREALRIAPGDALAEANLAALLGLRGEQDEAMQRLRGIVARAPQALTARLNLAAQLLLERDPHAALALFEGPPPAGPEGVLWRAQRMLGLVALRRHAEAHAELAEVSGPPGDAKILLAWLHLVLDGAQGAARTAQIEHLASLADDEHAALLEHRIMAHFDLGDLHDAAPDRAAAFAHWHKGHRLLGRMQPFARSRHTAFLDATMRRFDADRFRRGPRADTADPAPVFIVGMPRSGTSLTEQILAAHPLVHGAGERLAVYKTLLSHAGSVLTPHSVARAAGLDAATLTRCADHFLAELHAPAPQARRVTDKMPGNSLHLGFIATLLPGARVIVCTRDPRDIGLSIFRRRFLGYHPYAHDLGDLGWYIGAHARLLDHWRQVLPLPMLTVALADWIEDFAGTLARVLAFLDLPPAEECARFHASGRRVRTASRDQVRRPINAAGLGRWRAYRQQLAPLIAELETAGLLPPPND